MIENEREGEDSGKEIIQFLFEHRIFSFNTISKVSFYKRG
jgi:hypothetical protein